MDADQSIGTQAEWVAERTPLSEREAEVLIHYELAGHDTYKKDIAERLGINPSTFSEHLSNARDKLTTDKIGEAYWQFYSPYWSGMDIRYRPVIEAPDENGRLLLFEDQFRDVADTPSSYWLVHEQAKQSRVSNRYVNPHQQVTNWYEFQSPKQVGAYVTNELDFAKESFGRSVFIDKFEEYFGFDPESLNPEDVFQRNTFGLQNIPDAHAELFDPTMTATDVQRTLEDHYERFRVFFASLDRPDLVTFKKPRVEDDATLVAVANGEDKQAVLMHDDLAYGIYSGECDCGYVNDFTPKRGEPSKSSYERRRKESCEHNVAVLNAVAPQNLTTGEPSEPEEYEQSPVCPRCGYTGVTERKSYNQGEWVMSEYRCAVCSEELGSE